jgi:signal transduction histidine kinase
MITFVMLHLTLLGTTVLPITVGISILRYRLWDIDLLLNRALVFGGLTLLIASAYVLMVCLFGALFHSRNNLALSILATGLIAILFHPLRQRLQRTINRLMYGERDDPATVLAKLGERLAYAAVPEATLPIIVETIAQALKLPYVAISETSGDGRSGELLTESGEPTQELTKFPLVYQGQAIGKLLAAQRAPAETFTPAEQRLLENIAQQAGAAVFAAQLTRHLQVSRQELVTSREEERRRIRRDLHDGLGPRLASLSLRLDATRNYLHTDPASADHELAELKGQVQEAIQDIRRLVYELRPPTLDQLGLVPALRQFAAQHNTNGVYFEVQAPESLPILPAAVEVAAYRIAMEGMTNAARHANASRCSVRLTAGDNLHLEIEDNGVGMRDRVPYGVGLASMRERAAELSGDFRLQSSPGAGTLLSISLPIAGPE